MFFFCRKFLLQEVGGNQHFFFDLVGKIAFQTEANQLFGCEFHIPTWDPWMGRLDRKLRIFEAPKKNPPK